MKIEIPQIFWHGNNDRVMSIDFYPHTNYLVTCGAESEDKMWVKLWDLTQNQHTVEVDYRSRKQHAVKPVQYSPMSRNEVSVILDAHLALEYGCSQIPKH